MNDKEIKETLRDIFIYIGVSLEWAEDATIRTYIERLITKCQENK